MTDRQRRQPGYVLHRRAYRETSYLADILSPEFGRLACVFRGARKKQGASLEPFIRYGLAWHGKGQMVTVTSYDIEIEHSLRDRYLYAGLYLNELIVRALPVEVSAPPLFHAYDNAIASLARRDTLEPVLRTFERILLRESGYDVLFNYDHTTGDVIAPDKYYRFVPNVGFESTQKTSDALSGRVLLAIADDDYAKTETRRVAKHVLRSALKPLLGDRPMASRQLFRGSNNVV